MVACFFKVVVILLFLTSCQEGRNIDYQARGALVDPPEPPSKTEIPIGPGESFSVEFSGNRDSFKVTLFPNQIDRTFLFVHLIDLSVYKLSSSKQMLGFFSCVDSKSVQGSDCGEYEFHLTESLLGFPFQNIDGNIILSLQFRPITFRLSRRIDNQEELLYDFSVAHMSARSAKGPLNSYGRLTYRTLRQYADSPVDLKFILSMTWPSTNADYLYLGVPNLPSHFIGPLNGFDKDLIQTFFDVNKGETVQIQYLVSELPDEV